MDDSEETVPVCRVAKSEWGRTNVTMTKTFFARVCHTTGPGSFFFQLVASVVRNSCGLFCTMIIYR